MFQTRIDVGGAFTDYTAFGSDGSAFYGETPSAPRGESKAVLQALAEIAVTAGLSATELLKSTEVINFGTTVVQCASAEHRTRKRALA